MNEDNNNTMTQADIDNYIHLQAEESINLDFKRGDALKIDDKTKREISKDVSAFANSDGGIIIYGIEEKNFKADNLVFVNGNIITKEWLEQIINSRIQRKIDGLIIEPIRYNGNIEQTIFVVKIPRSLNAPHMTSEKRFYKRYNFESVEMEEYEVRNLYTRQDKTHLEIGEPKISGSANALIGGKPMDFNASIQINIINKGQTIEKLYKVEVRTPRIVTIGSNPYSLQTFFNYLVRHEETHSVFSIPNGSPLFQNELATIGTVDLKITSDNLHDLQNNPIIIRLFYSNGTEEKSFMLLDHLEFNGKKLTRDLLR
jgi:hypothetical protein